ncbi:hypothetical protein TERMP_00089 [Thermococcus barophilus MP]|uniref:Uncharacterized protein n=1 Tax=Thermococcus barophilus (strain DSM 11836 / MP) TaxID=391623 RepID=F0LHA5_THEBM|nr:hypothetical protein TERMP_00089 [Thermococcus barophilus MP]
MKKLRFPNKYKIEGKEKVLSLELKNMRGKGSIAPPIAKKKGRVWET